MPVYRESLNVGGMRNDLHLLDYCTRFKDPRLNARSLLSDSACMTFGTKNIQHLPVDFKKRAFRKGQLYEGFFIRTINGPYDYCYKIWTRRQWPFAPVNAPVPTKDEFVDAIIIDRNGGLFGLACGGNMAFCSGETLAKADIDPEKVLLPMVGLKVQLKRINKERPKEIPYAAFEATIILMASTISSNIQEKVSPPPLSVIAEEGSAISQPVRHWKGFHEGRKYPNIPLDVDDLGTNGNRRYLGGKKKNYKQDIMEKSFKHSDSRLLEPKTAKLHDILKTEVGNMDNIFTSSTNADSSSNLEISSQNKSLNTNTFAAPSDANSSTDIIPVCMTDLTSSSNADSSSNLEISSQNISLNTNTFVAPLDANSSRDIIPVCMSDQNSSSNISSGATVNSILDSSDIKESNTTDIKSMVINSDVIITTATKEEVKDSEYTGIATLAVGINGFASKEFSSVLPPQKGVMSSSAPNEKCDYNLDDIHNEGKLSQEQVIKFSGNGFRNCDGDGYIHHVSTCNLPTRQVITDIFGNNSRDHSYPVESLISANTEESVDDNVQDFNSNIITNRRSEFSSLDLSTIIDSVSTSSLPVDNLEKIWNSSRLSAPGNICKFTSRLLEEQVIPKAEFANETINSCSPNKPSIEVSSAKFESTSQAQLNTMDKDFTDLFEENIKETINAQEQCTEMLSEKVNYIIKPEFKDIRVQDSLVNNHEKVKVHSEEERKGLVSGDTQSVHLSCEKNENHQNGRSEFSSLVLSDSISNTSLPVDNLEKIWNCSRLSAPDNICESTSMVLEEQVIPKTEFANETIHSCSPNKPSIEVSSAKCESTSQAPLCNMDKCIINLCEENFKETINAQEQCTEILSEKVNDNIKSEFKDIPVQDNLPSLVNNDENVQVHNEEEIKGILSEDTESVHLSCEKNENHQNTENDIISDADTTLGLLLNSIIEDPELNHSDAMNVNVSKIVSAANELATSNSNDIPINNIINIHDCRPEDLSSIGPISDVSKQEGIPPVISIGEDYININTEDSIIPSIKIEAADFSEASFGIIDISDSQLSLGICEEPLKQSNTEDYISTKDVASTISIQVTPPKSISDSNDSEFFTTCHTTPESPQFHTPKSDCLNTPLESPMKED